MQAWLAATHIAKPTGSSKMTRVRQNATHLAK
jgi:hypothetical protein